MKGLTVYAVAQDTLAFYYAESRSEEAARIAGGWAGAWAGGKLGFKAGVLLAGIGGQAGPQAAAPEEAVTVPVAGIVGGFIGSYYGYGGGSSASKRIYEHITSEEERLSPPKPQSIQVERAEHAFQRGYNNGAPLR